MGKGPWKHQQDKAKWGCHGCDCWLEESKRLFNMALPAVVQLIWTHPSRLPVLQKGPRTYAMSPALMQTDTEVLAWMQYFFFPALQKKEKSKPSCSSKKHNLKTLCHWTTHAHIIKGIQSVEHWLKYQFFYQACKPMSNLELPNKFYGKNIPHTAVKGSRGQGYKKQLFFPPYSDSVFENFLHLS